MNHPDLIYILDETGLQPDHRPPNIVAPLDTRPQAITSPRSTTLTLIGCTNALGNSLPPFFVFKGKRYSEELLQGSTPGATGVMSDPGWSNKEIFQQYLNDHFLKYVRPSPTEKLLLLYDGHSSHISPTLIQWARGNMWFFSYCRPTQVTCSSHWTLVYSDLSKHTTTLNAVISHARTLAESSLDTTWLA